MMNKSGSIRLFIALGCEEKLISFDVISHLILIKGLKKPWDRWILVIIS